MIKTSVALSLRSTGILGLQVIPHNDNHVPGCAAESGVFPTVKLPPAEPIQVRHPLFEYRPFGAANLTRHEEAVQSHLTTLEALWEEAMPESRSLRPYVINRLLGQYIVNTTSTLLQDRREGNCSEEVYRLQISALCEAIEEVGKGIPEISQELEPLSYDEIEVQSTHHNKLRQEFVLYGENLPPQNKFETLISYLLCDYAASHPRHAPEILSYETKAGLHWLIEEGVIGFALGEQVKADYKLLANRDDSEKKGKEVLAAEKRLDSLWTTFI